jgi:hypothetical protein
MTTKDEIMPKTAITSDEIDKMHAILAQLNSNTDRYFDIEKDQRTALIKRLECFLDQIGTNFPDVKWKVSS